MAHAFGKGASVRWKWGSGEARGKIVERFDRRVSRTLKGKRITRVGNAENPAYLIEQDEGDRVLKRGSELLGG
jgi:predicted HD phosphohydrolase